MFITSKTDYYFAQVVVTYSNFKPLLLMYLEQQSHSKQQRDVVIVHKMNEMDNWHPHHLAIVHSMFTIDRMSFLSLATLRKCQMKHAKKISSFHFGELEETTRTPSYYADEDYPARPEIQQPLPE